MSAIPELVRYIFRNDLDDQDGEPPFCIHPDTVSRLDVSGLNLLVLMTLVCLAYERARECVDDGNRKSMSDDALWPGLAGDALVQRVLPRIEREARARGIVLADGAIEHELRQIEPSEFAFKSLSRSGAVLTQTTMALRKSRLVSVRITYSSVFLDIEPLLHDVPSYFQQPGAPHYIELKHQCASASFWLFAGMMVPSREREYVPAPEAIRYIRLLQRRLEP